MGRLEARIGPLALARPRRAWHLVERSVLVYRRRPLFVVSGFFEPFFFLLSIGIGLNHLVGRVSADGRVLSYTLFVAPGLLATSAMNGAVFDATYNLFYKLKVAKTFDGVLATPIGIGDIALGELGWAVTRGVLYSAGFLLVMTGLGLIGSPWALLCLPAAALISLAFGAIGAAATTYMHAWQDLGSVSLAMLPMFLFSGTFFQLSVYPPWLATIVRLTPLYQGVALLRSLDIGAVSSVLFVHVGYLLAMTVLGLVISSRRLQALLAP